MKLVQPFTGVVVDASEEAVPRLIARGYKEPKAKKSSRPTKAELLEEVEQELTNPEMAEAIEKAKKSPAKPKLRKKD